MSAAWRSPLTPALVEELGDFRALHDFYFSYHQSRVNFAIHIVAVPLLSTAVLLALAATTTIPTGRGGYAPAGGGKPPPPTPWLALDAGAAVSAAYALYFGWLAPRLGPFAAAVLASQWLLARAVRAALGSRRAAVGVAAAAAAAAQVAMVVGHWGWEGKPNAVLFGAAKAVAGAPLLLHVELALRGGWLPEVAALLRGAAGGAAA